MSENYKPYPFGPNYPDGKDQNEFDPDNAFVTKFKESIPDLIKDGILDGNATNDEGLTTIDETVYKYGNGGPSALSKM